MAQVAGDSRSFNFSFGRRSRMLKQSVVLIYYSGMFHGVWLIVGTGTAAAAAAAVVYTSTRYQ